MRQINILLAIALSLMHLESKLLAQQNGNYYHLVLEEVSWDEAVEICLDRGGNLATVTSETEWNQIKQQLGNSINGLDLWLGGRADPNDQESDPRKRRWIWVTGEPWDYSRWRRLEPDGNFGGIGSSSTEVIPQRAQITNGTTTQTRLFAFSKYEIKGYIGEFGWASVSGNLRYVGTRVENLPHATGGPVESDGHTNVFNPGSTTTQMPFMLSNLVKGFEYTFRAFRDVNGNGREDDGEPNGQYIYTPHLLTEDLNDVTITVYDENSPPHPLVLNGQSVHDNDEIGTEVGTLLDPNPGQDLFVYVIEPTHKFRVDGDKLITTTTFNSNYNLNP